MPAGVGGQLLVMVAGYWAGGAGLAGLRYKSKVVLVPLNRRVELFEATVVRLAVEASAFEQVCKVLGYVD